MVKELPLSYYQVREIVNLISETEAEEKEQYPLCSTAHCEGIWEGKRDILKKLKEILKKKKADLI